LVDSLQLNLWGSEAQGDSNVIGQLGSQSDIDINWNLR